MAVDFFKENLHWVCLLVFALGRIFWLLYKGEAKEVTPAEATLLMNREHAMLIDLRADNDREGGYIPKARLIALENLREKLPDIEKFKTRPVVVYAANDKQATKAFGILRKGGFDQVYILTGGANSWKQAGLPLATK